MGVRTSSPSLLRTGVEAESPRFRIRAPRAILSENLDPVRVTASFPVVSIALASSALRALIIGMIFQSVEQSELLSGKDGMARPPITRSAHELASDGWVMMTWTSTPIFAA
jgi:hypothetical protein